MPFCQERWGDGKMEPDPEYERRRQKMLLIYPLPEGWQEIYDPGTGRHFYWCLETDRVSWFPPGHPKAIPVLAAAQVRKNLSNQKISQEKEIDKEVVWQLEFECKVIQRKFKLHIGISGM